MNGSRALRDRVLADDVRDALVSHRRLNGCDLSVDVHGGVAHVTGIVQSAEERSLVRRIIGRVRGIHAVWDMLRTPIEESPCALDIGCGNKKQWDCAIGVDRHMHPAVDVIAEIERGLPFADGSIDHVFAVHFLEHVHNIIGIMNEIHRVLRPGGVLHVMVPNWQYVNAVADPTHVRFFHLQTFKFFCRPYPGLREFRPLSVSASAENLFADLQPIKDGEQPNSEETLCRFFD